MRHEHGSISESERTALSPARQRDATGRQAVATKRALSSADGEPLATASAPVASVCAAKREPCAQDEDQQAEPTVAVFDVSQTDGLPGAEPVSLESPCQPIQGDTHTHLLPALEQLAVELGYSVARRPLDGPADGWCDTHKQEIVINDELPANAQVRVLVHEIAHALGVGYSDYGRRRAEVLVDTVTFIVCGAVGLDTPRRKIFGSCCIASRSTCPSRSTPSGRWYRCALDAGAGRHIETTVNYAVK